MKTFLALLATLLLPLTTHLGAQTLLDFTGSSTLTQKQTLFDQNFYRTYGNNDFNHSSTGGIRATSSLRAIFGSPKGATDGPYHSGNTHYLSETLAVDFVSPGALNGSSGGIGFYTRIQSDTNLGIYGQIRITGENSVVFSLRYGANAFESSSQTSTGTSFFQQTLTSSESLLINTAYRLELKQTGTDDPSFTLSLLSANGDLLATSGSVALSLVANPTDVALYSQPGAIGMHYFAGDHPARLARFEVIPEPSTALLLYGTVGAAMLLMLRRSRN